MSNTITATQNGYTITTAEGHIIHAVRFFETKTGKWHIRLPKNNSTGREFIREDKFLAGETTFENKTTGPRVLGPSAKKGEAVQWQEILNEEEKSELAAAVETIKRLKDKALKIINPPVGSEAYYIREIEKMKARLEAMKQAKEQETVEAE